MKLCYVILLSIVLFLEHEHCRWHYCAQCQNIGPACTTLHPAALWWHRKESLTWTQRTTNPHQRCWGVDLAFQPLEPCGVHVCTYQWLSLRCLGLALGMARENFHTMTLGFQKLLGLWTVRVCSWAIHRKRKGTIQVMQLWFSCSQRPFPVAQEALVGYPDWEPFPHHGCPLSRKKIDIQ